jgi:acyl-CoA dehydrogenase
MDFAHSPRALDYLARVRRFVKERIQPAEEAHLRDVAAQGHGGDWTRWQASPVVEGLKEQARAEGLWNLFLSDPQAGAGLKTLEYAPLAEEMGRSVLAPEVFNCSAPDTGNMELLWHYGSAAQKERWLGPLLNGRIRSTFCMTEPDVASSDPTGLRATIAVDGDDLVLNGRKWWSTGVGHPRCEVAIFMGVSDPQADRHRRHSMVLVPLATAGVTVKRMLPVFGFYDEPHGHGEVWFEDVRVPRDGLVGSLGQAFEIAQARLGPGRIHHCMRAIGAAERALELLVTRGMARSAFGRPLLDLGGNRERVADLRVAVDQARLLTLHAAWRIDTVGARAAMADVSAIKLAAPQALQTVVDAAIQVHGAAGLSQDVPLAGLFTLARVLRIADGPDEVHRAVIASAEMARYRQAPAAPAAG